jgi:hypothetical protein
MDLSRERGKARPVGSRGLILSVIVSIYPRPANMSIGYNGKQKSYQIFNFFASDCYTAVAAVIT